MTVSFFTLGCKLNQYESDALASEFRQAGFRVVEAEDAAEICIINTCTVTNRADRKSRNLINRAGRQLDKARLMVVTGCFAETASGGPVTADQTAGSQAARGLTAEDQPPPRDPAAAPRPSAEGAFPTEVPQPPADSEIPTLWVDNDQKSDIFRLVCEHPAIRTAAGFSSAEAPEQGGGRFAFRTTGSGFHTRSRTAAMPSVPTASFRQYADRRAAGPVRRSWPRSARSVPQATAKSC